MLRRHTLYTSSTQPIRVYAYCVDTHWHAAHYSPPAFDRPRSKQGDSSETNQRWRSSRQKKICSWATLVFNKLRIERLVHPRWSSHSSARSLHGFNQQASNVLWWILTQSSFHQRTHITDVMISYYKPSHSSAQSKAVLLTLTASVFPLTYVIHQSLMVYKYKSTILQHRSYFHSCVQRVPSHIHFVAVSIRYT